jgi:uncharacterized protein YecE (DUF72 family)
VRIGTVDLPDRMERERYFRELDFLELSALFAGPLKPSVLAKWEVAPKGSLALVAPWVLTHRKPPKANVLWPHDASVGDFRDSAPGRAALVQFAAAVKQLGASHAVFRSPSLFAASAANRDALKKFFGEIATPEAVGGAVRVWIPDGLWDLRTAVTFANELGVVCAFDPLVRDPGQPPEVHFDLELPALYLRVTGLGRSGPIRSERLDDLVMLMAHHAEAEGGITVAFESPSRWNDARNLKKSIVDAVD